MPLAAGSRLGSYEILAPLGAGGMGEVYRARDPKLAREVAIKVLPEDVAADATALARFEREARAIAALSHPNILAIHDFGASDGVTFAVMELLHGETLRQRLDHGAIPARRATEIAREIALGLAAAHERGVIHRDLKPENLFLTKDGLVKILDFGLARQVAEGQPRADQTLTDPSQSGVVVGTAGYMSPEQIRGAKADHRSDIFSFGAVIYEMLTSKRAFRGETPADTMSAILNKEPPPLSESGRQTSPALERIVAHCLEKQPSDRFQSARDLAFDLGTLTAVTSAPDTLAPDGRLRRSRNARARAAIAAVIGIVLAFWAGDRYRDSRRRGIAPTFRRLTFRRGIVESAYFAPDERTVVYGAAWEGHPFELFSVRTDSVESRPLGIEKAQVMSISSKGELAVALERIGSIETLGRAPLGGGSVREVLESVGAASWAPDGEDLAILRAIEGRGGRLEYPIGHAVYEAPKVRPPMDLSPDGKFIAVVEMQRNFPKASILAIDRKGEKRILVSDLERRPAGLAWSPDSREVYFVGGKTSETRALRAVTLSGRERVVLPMAGASLRLLDVGPSGRFLIERYSKRRGLTCLGTVERKEREIAWLDGSDVRGLSDDGTKIILREGGDGARNPAGGVYMRGCDGSPAVRLGDGEPHNISSDGKWVFTLTTGEEPEIVLLPTGSGTPRKVSLGLKPDYGGFLPDGKHIFISEGVEHRLWVAAIDGGPPHRVRDDDATPNGWAISPDGTRWAYMASSGQPMVAPLFGGGEPRPLPGPPISLSEGIRQWSADGRYLYIGWYHALPGRVTRREIATGNTEPWLEVQPADSAGVTGILNLKMTRDGRTVVYSYERTEVSDLFVVDGLK